jgi:predicted protein tyrosine phosphatase
MAAMSSTCPDLSGAVGVQCEDDMRGASLFDLRDVGANASAATSPQSASKPLDCIVPRIFLASHSQAKDADLIRRHGISHVLVCGPDYELSTPFVRGAFESEAHQIELQYTRLPFEDDECEDLLAHIPAALSFVDSVLAQAGTNILVHCRAGVSRSASICCAIVARDRKLSAAAAIAFVKQRRSCVCPNAGFLEQLGDFVSMQWTVDRESEIWRAHTKRLEARRVVEEWRPNMFAPIAFETSDPSESASE